MKSKLSHLAAIAVTLGVSLIISSISIETNKIDCEERVERVKISSEMEVSLATKEYRESIERIKLSSKMEISSITKRSEMKFERYGLVYRRFQQSAVDRGFGYWKIIEGEIYFVWKNNRPTKQLANGA